MLEPLIGDLRIIPIRSLDPIPPAIPMSSQPPGLITTALILESPSKNHDHPRSRPDLTQGPCMVHPGGGFQRPAVHILPGVRHFFDVQDPHVVHRGRPRVPPEHHQERFAVDQTVSVPFPWGRA
jgi:hypothetical protein